MEVYLTRYDDPVERCSLRLPSLTSKESRILKHQEKKGNCDDGQTLLKSSYKNAKIILLCLVDSNTIESDQMHSTLVESEYFSNYNIQCATQRIDVVYHHYVPVLPLATDWLHFFLSKDSLQNILHLTISLPAENIRINGQITKMSQISNVEYWKSIFRHTRFTTLRSLEINGWVGDNDLKTILNTCKSFSLLENLNITTSGEITNSIIQYLCSKWKQALPILRTLEIQEVNSLKGISVNGYIQMITFVETNPNLPIETIIINERSLLLEGKKQHLAASAA